MKTLNKILIVAGILVLLAVSYFVITNFIITGKVVGIEYHTQAICDDDKICQDYEIYCEGENLIKIIPIDEAIIQNVENWSDPRGEFANKLC